MTDQPEYTDDDAPDAPPKGRGASKRRPPPAVVDLGAARDAKRMNEWRQLLRHNQGGALTKDPGNLVLLLANDERWRDKLAWNAFSERVVWREPPEAMAGFPMPEAGEFDETDYVYVQHWFARHIGVSFAKDALRPAVKAAARVRSFHPVAEWLRSLRWDGQRRVPTWLRTYLRAHDEPHVDKVGQWWLISAVARVMSPGCQADHVLVLQGAQGAGKSSAARILGGEWYLPSLPDVRDATRASSALRGRWLVEIGELDAIRGANATRIKDFISACSDVYRGAYAELELERRRQCVFIGTTNEHAILTDPTGARRWWPVHVGTVDREALRADRDQLWAEAVALYESGVPWHPDEDSIADLAEAQDSRYQADEWEARVSAWVDGPPTKQGFTVGDALAGAVGLPPERWERTLQTRMGNVLSRLGYRSYQRREGALRIRRYWPEGSLRLERE